MYQQFVVGADFDDFSLFDYDDLVGFRDRAQPMGDHDRGPVLQQFSQRRLNQSFTFAVQVAGRFVQDQDFWIGQDRPRDGNSLPLSTREFDATFADHRVVAIGQASE